MILTIPVGESREIFGQGDYFWIATASGPLVAEVTATDGRRSTHKVNARFQVRVPGGIRSVQLTNRHSTTNTLEADSGIGEYIPSNDGQKVSLTGSDVTLEIQGKAGGVPVQVAGPLTNTQLRATDVPVSGPLTDTELRALSVDVNLASQATSVQVHTVPGATLNTPAPVVPTVAGATIAANAAREEITLYAPAANLLPVWIGSAAAVGIPLEPGKNITLKTTAAIPLFGGNGTDKVTYLEVQ